MSENPNVDDAGPWADFPMACRHLDRTAIEITRVVNDLQLLGVRFSDGNLYFPVWQFSGGTVEDGVREVLHVLNTGIASPMVWATWLAGPGPDRQQTIWDALRADRKAEVIEAAYGAAPCSGAI